MDLVVRPAPIVVTIRNSELPSCQQSQLSLVKLKSVAVLDFAVALVSDGAPLFGHLLTCEPAT
jgi:hypothetical protein